MYFYILDSLFWSLKKKQRKCIWQTSDENKRSNMASKFYYPILIWICGGGVGGNQGQRQRNMAWEWEGERTVWVGDSRKSRRKGQALMSFEGGNRSLWAHPVKSQPPFLTDKQSTCTRLLCMCYPPYIRIWPWVTALYGKDAELRGDKTTQHGGATCPQITCKDNEEKGNSCNKPDPDTSSWLKTFLITNSCLWVTRPAAQHNAVYQLSASLTFYFQVGPFSNAWFMGSSACFASQTTTLTHLILPSLPPPCPQRTSTPCHIYLQSEILQWGCGDAITNNGPLYEKHSQLQLTRQCVCSSYLCQTLLHPICLSFTWKTLTQIV